MTSGTVFSVKLRRISMRDAFLSHLQGIDYQTFISVWELSQTPTSTMEPLKIEPPFENPQCLYA